MEADINTAVEVKSQGFLANLFGQFSSKEFWKGLVSMIVREAVSSFISVLGGTLIYAVQQRTTKESSSIRNIAGGAGKSTIVQTPTASPNNAFSNGYAPQPVYKPTFHSTTQPYPGFGQ